MTLSAQIDEHFIPAWEDSRVLYCQGTGLEISMEQYVQVRMDELTQEYASALANKQRQQTGSSDDMVVINLKLQALPDEERATKLAEIHALLDALAND